MSQGLHLGPFLLDARLGKGGMGEVWSGRHSAQGDPVAVKVMTVEHHHHPHFRLFFEREIQSAAALDHPGIITLLDHGEVDEEAAQRSAGILVAGSPYLVMELADLGTLHQVQNPLYWPHLRRILLAILDALAHAHARGVIHRDLKPANVLFATDTQGHAQLKLSDFGIAATMVGGANIGEFSGGTAGTPGYMAPEQLQGAWRDHGPWTDLYAVGCIAYELACGHPPFPHGDVQALIDAHLHTPVAPPRSPLPLPRAWSGWVLRLLHKNPDKRFGRAADAAWALRQLPEHLPRTLSPPGPLPALILERAQQQPETLDAVPSTRDEHSTLPAMPALESLGNAPSTVPSAEWVTPAQHIPPTPAQTMLAPCVTPPLPDTWRGATRKRRPVQLLGAGLGLYGLRNIPLVDREPERDQIWRALAQVHRQRRARVILLEGPAGVGKSRLVSWICERAHEVGGATLLKATHSPFASPADGLPRTLAAYLNCIGLGRTEVLERTRRQLAQHALPGDEDFLADSLALTELMMPSVSYTPLANARLVLTQHRRDEKTPFTPAPPSLRRLSKQPERHQALARFLARLTQERPVVLWLDDVQWGHNALLFTRYLIESQNQTPLPVLVLLTAQGEELARRPIEAVQLRELLALEPVTRLELGPLTAQSHAALVEQLLGLEGELAAEVEARTAGNPLFAVQLIGDWVQRGILELSEDGFRLTKGAHASLPDDIHQLWLNRIERLEKGPWQNTTPHTLRQLLEIAAALGNDIDLEEWREVCTIAGHTIPRGLVPAMITRRLATSHETGWSFAHAMLRESLERSAREAHRWEAHQRHCVTMLEQRYPRQRSGIAERLSEHLLAAGQLNAACDALLAAAEEHGGTSDFDKAHALFEQREHALDTLGVDPDDFRRAKGWTHRATLYATQGQLPLATDLIERALPRLDPAHHLTLIAELRLAQGNVERKSGQLERGFEHFKAAQRHFTRLGDALGVARCHSLMGEISRMAGRLDDAREAYQNALTAFEAHEDRVGLGNALAGLAYTCRQQGEHEEAEALMERALSSFRAAHHRLGVASSLNNLGEMARFAGDLERAEACYRKAIDASHGVHAHEVTLFHVNFAILLLARRQFDAARPWLERALNELERSGQRIFLGFVHAELLPCCAAARDWEAWERHIGHARSELQASGMHDEDIARPAEIAGDLARDAQRPDAALEAYALATAQWSALQRTEDLDRVQAKIRAFSSP